MIEFEFSRTFGKSMEIGIVSFMFLSAAMPLTICIQTANVPVSQGVAKFQAGKVEIPKENPCLYRKR